MADGGKANRGTIEIEDARLVELQSFPGEQFVLRLHSPRCAARAAPGSFVHLACDPQIPMRRPLSIMRVDPAAGWIEVLFKIVGDGLRALSRRRVGDTLSVLGPIGVPFRPDAERPHALLIGGGVGIPPMVFLAEQLSGDPPFRPLVLMGSEIPYPFRTARSELALPGAPAAASHTMPLLESLGVPTRLASNAGLEGCFAGYVTDLARVWLDAQPPQTRAATAIYSCGPTPMLKAVAALAGDYDLPCQVSLEEYMACAVGGCAGCTVAVHGSAGVQMKRVCVDGPVFDAAAVFPDAA